MTTSSDHLGVHWLTIGVYGFTEETFFEALTAAGVDSLCDIRQRRGVRGKRYAFANSKRLQARLAALGIRYLHHKPLAPTADLRQTQHAVDTAANMPKRKRLELSPAFVAVYKVEILGSFDVDRFAEALPDDARVVAFLCVESKPDACHRSLAVEHVCGELGGRVSHILPEG